jgi:hypothetical protein
MRFPLNVAAALSACVWSAAAAAPASCTAIADGSEAFLAYDINRFDLVARFNGYLETARPTECAASFVGSLNTATGTGLALFNDRDEYRVSLAGDLGTSFFFDEDYFFDYDLISETPPAYRLDFRPLAGASSEALFPGGLSFAFGCEVTDSCRPVPFFLIREREIDGCPTPYRISNDGRMHAVSALDPVAAVPIPASFPLAALALAGLAGFARLRRKPGCGGRGAQQRRREAL